MPRLSVWLVRTALAFFAAGVTLGAAALAGKGFAAGPWVSRLVPIHAEFLLVGWTVQLVLGVAYWILPRLRTGAERGSPTPAWVAYGTLNAGILMTAFGGAFGAGTSWAATGRGLEVLAAATFVLQAWPRIRGSREGACAAT